ETVPLAVLAAILRPLLAARRAGAVRHPAELACLGGLQRAFLALLVAELPLAVVALELLARLARHRAVRVHRPLVEAGVVAGDGGPDAAGEDCECAHGDHLAEHSWCHVHLSFPADGLTDEQSPCQAGRRVARRWTARRSPSRDAASKDRSGSRRLLGR